MNLKCTFVTVHAAEQHWLLIQKPSRQETAGSVVHRYSVTASHAISDWVAIVKVIKTAFRPTNRNSICEEVRLRAASDTTVKGHSRLIRFIQIET